MATERFWYSLFYSWRHNLATIANCDRFWHSQLHPKNLVAVLITGALGIGHWEEAEG
jgi:hypothetical protein